MLKNRLANSKQNGGKGRSGFLPAEKIFEKIQVRAYEIYKRRGNNPGNASSDWTEAEKQIKKGLRIS